MSETAQGSGMWCAFTPQMAYEVWRDSERDEAEGETRWHMLAAEINIRLQNMNPPAAASPDPVAVERHARIVLHNAMTTLRDHLPMCVGDAEFAERSEEEADAAIAKAERILAAAPRADATAEVIDPSCTSCNGTGWWGAVEQYCQCADGRRAAAADATAGEVTEVLIAALRDIATNYDHDEQTREHTPGYGGACRVCTAEAALRAAQPTSGGDDA